jgi:hypothetical protein
VPTVVPSKVLVGLLPILPVSAIGLIVPVPEIVCAKL